MKKIIALALVAVLALAMFACGGAEETTVAAGETTVEAPATTVEAPATTVEAPATTAVVEG